MPYVEERTAVPREDHDLRKPIGEITALPNKEHTAVPVDDHDFRTIPAVPSTIFAPKLLMLCTRPSITLDGEASEDTDSAEAIGNSESRMLAKMSSSPSFEEAAKEDKAKTLMLIEEQRLAGKMGGKRSKSAHQKAKKAAKK